MRRVTFEELAALEYVQFDVFDGATGNLVTSYESFAELQHDLPGLIDESRERAPTLIVYALNEKGRRIGSSPATDLLSTAA
jgi:hypothetical protein